MSYNHSNETRTPHIMFFPSPGMGHLTPFLRLASILSSRNCVITLISTEPCIFPEESAQFSSFFSSHPNINRLGFNILQENSSNSPTDDAFILQCKAINSSIHHLPPLLSSLTHPISAIFSDFVVAASLSELMAKINIPIYIVLTTSARCYSTVTYLPILLSNTSSKFDNVFPEKIEIPGLSPLPKSIIPPSWLDDSPSNRLLKDYLIPNSLSLPKVNGVLLNSFNWFEQETISPLLDNKVLRDFPIIYPIGPLEPYGIEKECFLPWLDDRPEKSVVYVNFGCRTILSGDQIREIGKGLERSGYFFLWVLRANVGGEDENELIELIDKSFIERIKNKGMVMKGMVNQSGILAHPAIGGFVNQCEWESVTESAREGVPMLAWPQHGDHKMNAEVVEKAGLGIWVKDWGWSGERVVGGEEIEVRVREFMGDMILREKAKKVKKEAKKAFEVGGSSKNALTKVIHMLKQTDKRLV